jgi:single-strand DNA-binding protein
MLNSFTGIGNLAADPEVKQTQSGKTVASFTVCCDSGYGDKKTTEFVRCVAWEKSAEFLGNYAHKGNKVYINGRMQTRTWDDQNGNKKYTTEIIVHDVKLLDGKKDDGRQQEKPQQFDAPPF